MNIRMEDDISALDEVVVTGYGSRLKTENALSKEISKNDVTSIVGTSVPEVLQGRAAGIQIRGAASIRSNANRYILSMA